MTVERLRRVAAVAGSAFLGVAGAAMLGDFLLRGPGGVGLYFLTAYPLDVAAFLLAAFASSWKRDLPPAGGPMITRVAAVLVVIAFSAASAWYVPYITESVLRALYHSDPIGVGDDVAREPCQTRRAAAVRSRKGLVAEVRETVCSGNWDGELMYFVFVHKFGESNTKQNLVFRYSADTLPETKPPMVAWAADNDLLIVAHWNILEITYQLFHTKDASIAYDLRSNTNNLSCGSGQPITKPARRTG